MRVNGSAVTQQVHIDGPSVVATFDRYDLESYELFLRSKGLPEREVAYDWRTDTYRLTAPSRFAGLLDATLGEQIKRERPALATHLFEYQTWIVQYALEARRFACWCDTGLGKTAIFLEWARQVIALSGGRVLILSPLQICRQTMAEATRFYGDVLPVEQIATREALAAWCKAEGPGLAICNYEKLIPGVLPELRYLAGLVCDESSILKTGGGTIKWNLIKSARGIEYKLSCTATPAPNDTMEYASQASFLETIRHEGEVLWTYFTRDKSGNWRVKPHARQAFYEFMASWSIYLQNPAHFGWTDILAQLPPPDVREYTLPLGAVQRELMHAIVQQKGGGLFADDRLGVTERIRLSQLSKGFLYDGKGKARTAVLVESAKPAFVADLVREDVLDGRQVLLWTVFDEEGEILRRELGDGRHIGLLTGGQPMAERLETIERFKAGELAILISKAQLLGYGLNFQNCRSMVFSGFDDSFERLYQAVRRCYRFGQTDTVRVHVPYIPELEGMMFSNLKRKQELFERDCAIQEAHYRKVLGMVA